MQEGIGEQKLLRGAKCGIYSPGLCHVYVLLFLLNPANGVFMYLFTPFWLPLLVGLLLFHLNIQKE